MSDAALKRPVEGPTCPLLGLPDDPDTRFSFPSEAHRCRAKDRPQPIDLGHQVAYCLADAYPTCPRYVAAASRPSRASKPVPVAIAITELPGSATAVPAIETRPAPQGGPPLAPAATHVPAATPVPPATPVPSGWIGEPRSGASPVARAPLARVGLPPIVTPERTPESPRRSMALWRRVLAVALAVVVVAASALLGGPILADWLRGAGVGAVSGSPAPSVATLITPAPSPSIRQPTQPPASPGPTPTTSSAPTTTLRPTRTPGSRIHVVAKGETLIGIAATYGVTVAAIEKANAIVDPAFIYVGEQLLIPAR